MRKSTLVVNCIAAFDAGPPAVQALRAAGFEVDVAHVGPTVTEHISVHGRYYYDLDRPPKGLGRPRRVAWSPSPGRPRPAGARPGRRGIERGPTTLLVRRLRWFLVR